MEFFVGRFVGGMTEKGKRLKSRSIQAEATIIQNEKIVVCP